VLVIAATLMAAAGTIAVLEITSPSTSGSPLASGAIHSPPTTTSTSTTAPPPTTPAGDPTTSTTSPPTTTSASRPDACTVLRRSVSTFQQQQEAAYEQYRTGKTDPSAGPLAFLSFIRVDAELQTTFYGTLLPVVPPAIQPDVEALLNYQQAAIAALSGGPSNTLDFDGPVNAVIAWGHTACGMDVSFLRHA
jgi:hypothetical protein